NLISSPGLSASSNKNFETTSFADLSSTTPHRYTSLLSKKYRSNFLFNIWSSSRLSSLSFSSSSGSSSIFQPLYSNFFLFIVYFLCSQHLQFYLASVASHSYTFCSQFNNRES